MVKNADKIGSHMTKCNIMTPDHERGKWLRDNSFDELPQIINVLGQMSIVELLTGCSDTITKLYQKIILD